MLPDDDGFVRGLSLDISPDAYRADPLPTPSLNASTAKVLLAQSPLHAAAQHPRLTEQAPRSEDKESESKLRGTVCHTLLLGKGARIAVLDYPAFRSNEAKAAKVAAIADGRVPVLKHKFARYVEVVNLLRAKLLAEHDIDFGRWASEAMVAWAERVTGDIGSTLIQCRAALDSLDDSSEVEHDEATGEVTGVVDGEIVIRDLKTVASAAPEAVRKAISNYGWDIQAAAYTAGVTALRPEMAGRIRFEWVFVETSPPYGIYVDGPAPSLQVIGARKWRRACHLWAKCTAADSWPDYESAGNGIEALPWAMNNELEHEDESMPDFGVDE
jgi:hypothetical protein